MYIGYERLKYRLYDKTRGLNSLFAALTPSGCYLATTGLVIATSSFVSPSSLRSITSSSSSASAFGLSRSCASPFSSSAVESFPFSSSTIILDSPSHLFEGWMRCCTVNEDEEVDGEGKEEEQEGDMEDVRR